MSGLSLSHPGGFSSSPSVQSSFAQSPPFLSSSTYPISTQANSLGQLQTQVGIALDTQYTTTNHTFPMCNSVLGYPYPAPTSPSTAPSAGHCYPPQFMYYPQYTTFPVPSPCQHPPCLPGTSAMPTQPTLQENPLLDPLFIQYLQLQQQQFLLMQQQQFQKQPQTSLSQQSQTPLQSPAPSGRSILPAANTPPGSVNEGSRRESQQTEPENRRREGEEEREDLSVSQKRHHQMELEGLPSYPSSSHLQIQAQQQQLQQQIQQHQLMQLQQVQRPSHQHIPTQQMQQPHQQVQAQLQHAQTQAQSHQANQQAHLLRLMQSHHSQLQQLQSQEQKVEPSRQVLEQDAVAGRRMQETSKVFTFGANSYDQEPTSEDEVCASPSSQFCFNPSDTQAALGASQQQIYFRKRKLETFRKKKTQRTATRSANNDRRGIAMFRPRDESGHFLPARKLQKTELLDLQNKLESSDYENHSLKHSLSEREKELESLKHRVRELEEVNSRLQRVESMEQLGTLRSYKQRMSYFHQLETVLVERRKIAEGLQDPPATSQTSLSLPSVESPLSSPITPATPISVASPMTISSPLTQFTPLSSLSSTSSNDVAMSPSSPSVVPSSPVEGTETESLSASPKTMKSKGQTAGEGQRSPRHIRAVPATWFSPDALWNTEILPAFKEKIDFSSIQLRHNTIPSNPVELAKVEYWEVQRRFEEQLSKINLTSQDSGEEGDYNMIGQGAKRIISKGHCGPFFSEKIDLKEELSKLRPTPPQVKQSTTDEEFINPTFVTVRNSLHHVTPTSPKPEVGSKTRMSFMETMDQPQREEKNGETNDGTVHLLAGGSLLGNGDHNTSDYTDVQMDSPPTSSLSVSPSQGNPLSLLMDYQFETSRNYNDDFSGKIFDIFSQQHPSEWFSIPTPTALLWRAELERKEPFAQPLSSWFQTENQSFQLS